MHVKLPPAAGARRFAIAAIVLLASGRTSVARASEPNVWGLDKQEIHVDGAVTLVLEKSAPPLQQLELCLDDREPIPLGATGSNAIHDSEGAYTLVWCDLKTANGFKEETREDSFRVIPLFHTPGERRIQLRTKPGEDLGTQTLRVIPVAVQAQDAVRALCPEIRKNGSNDKQLFAPILALTTTWGRAEQVDSRQLDELRSQMRPLAQHPDWAPVAEAVVRHKEAQFAVYTGVLVQAGKPVAPATLARATEALEDGRGGTEELKSSLFAERVADQTATLLSTQRQSLEALEKQARQQGKTNARD